MSSRSQKNKLVDLYTDALFAHFKKIRFTRSFSEKSMQYSHVLVPATLWGGKRDVVLCRRPWIAKVSAHASQHKIDLCHDCRHKLRQLARHLANHAAKDAYALLEGSKLVVLTSEEILAAFRALQQQEHDDREAVVEFDQLELPTEFAPTGSGKALPLWTIPMPSPSSASASSNPDSA